MFRPTLVAATLAIIAIGGSASAQTANSAPHRFQRGELFEGINLTAAQKSEIEAIRAKYHPELKSARDSIKPDWAALKTARTAKDSAAIRAARRDIRSDRKERGEMLKAEHDEIVKVLGPEQREKFEKNLKDWHADRQDRRADRRKELKSDEKDLQKDVKDRRQDSRDLKRDRKDR